MLHISLKTLTYHICGFSSIFEQENGTILEVILGVKSGNLCLLSEALKLQVSYFYSLWVARLLMYYLTTWFENVQENEPGFEVERL